MMSTKDTFEMSGPLSHLKPPDPTASVDERLDFIDVQLDGFGKDPVLTIYECLGASERRRGGVQPHLLLCRVKSSPLAAWFLTGVAFFENDC